MVVISGTVVELCVLDVFMVGAREFAVVIGVVIINGTVVV